MSASTKMHPSSGNTARPRRRRRVLLPTLMALLGATGPSLGADLSYDLLGTWQRQDTSTAVIAWLTFEPDGHLIVAELFINGIGPGMNEGFGSGAEYNRIGSLLTLDGYPAEGWPFRAERVTCSVAVSADRMELFSCSGWNRDTGVQPIELPDTVWVRAPRPWD